MKTLVIGEEIRREELKACLPTDLEIREVDIIHELGDENLSEYKYIFDLNADEDDALIQDYGYFPGSVVFLSSIKTQLSEMIDPFEYDGIVIGMNCLPTFINRPIKELSLFMAEDAQALDEILAPLNWQYRLVDDRVGMVAPRVLFMIINEACFTLQEGIADIESIDKSMKLGTNYPMGPFEWADKIGVKDVYETLVAIYADTRDERYKSCNLLKNKYLREEKFYN